MLAGDGVVTAWLAGIVAALVGVIGAWMAGMRSGRSRQRAKSDAQQEAAREHVAASKQEVQDEITKLPDAPAQKLGDTDRNTAAGKLASDWLRGPDKDGR